jgi:hypothetical protein
MYIAIAITGGVKFAYGPFEVKDKIVSVLQKKGYKMVSDSLYVNPQVISPGHQDSVEIISLFGPKNLSGFLRG